MAIVVLLPFFLIIEYIDRSWTHQIWCAIARGGERLVYLLSADLSGTRRSVSGWHGRWWLQTSFTMPPATPIVAVAMNYRGVPPLHYHGFYWHQVHIVFHDLYRLVAVEDGTAQYWTVTTSRLTNIISVTDQAVWTSVYARGDIVWV